MIPNEQISESKGECPPGLTFWQELTWYWRQWPSKPLWFGLLAAWILLFQFLGNATLGYIDTRSLFGWMSFVSSSIWSSF